MDIVYTNLTYISGHLDVDMDMRDLHGARVADLVWYSPWAGGHMDVWACVLLF